jgi:predicted DNA-binding transcriptional regulator YafY
MADPKKAVLIDYTNHRGERAMRRIHPLSLSFENNEWHPETQWILEAADLDKGGELRGFALKDIHSWQPA